MAKLDVEWPINEIDLFLHATGQVVPDMGPGVVYFGTVMRGPLTDASARAHVTEQILDRVLRGWRTSRPVEDEDFTWLRDQASHAKTVLQRSTELTDKLGDNAPDMDAANLHPWAWDNGKSLWMTGHFHQRSCRPPSESTSETQAKLGRMDVSETALFNEAFSLSDPKPDAPRLRTLKNDGSKTYENVHRGARAFAEGLYAAIRNPGMHVPSDGGEEQLALEQLAAFSLLARWVDQAEVVRG